MKLIEAAGLYVSRDSRTLLSDASFSLEAGTLHALLGPNGAGKSTLLRVLAGEWLPASGSVRLKGRPLRELTPLAQARCRAVLPQHDQLCFGFSVIEVVALGRLAARQRSRSHEGNLIAEVMAATDIATLATRSYPTLSGGEQRRVQLARVLAQVWDAEQPALLLDEPTHSLDPVHQHCVMELLRTLAMRGFGIVVSLHELNLAAAYADRISLLRAGRILTTGPVATVLSPANLSATYGEALHFSSVLDNDRPQWLSALKKTAGVQPSAVGR